MHWYISIDTAYAWKKLRFILSIRSDFHITDSLSIGVHAFVGVGHLTVRKQIISARLKIVSYKLFVYKPCIFIMYLYINWILYLITKKDCCAIKLKQTTNQLKIDLFNGGACYHEALCIRAIYLACVRGIMVTVVGNRHFDTSSNPRGNCWYFTTTFRKGIKLNILPPAMGR